MCGLIGIASFEKSGLFSDDINIFNDMLIADALRGKDGTGVFAVNAKGQRTGLKAEGNPYNLLRLPGYEKITDVTSQPYVQVLAGHNRFATTGLKDCKSSHPFYHKNITMMHNGTLRKYDLFPQEFAVDSESFTHAVATMGFNEAVTKMEGAYAVVFYDSAKKTLNFARNY